jgi:hypothetical protein
MTSQLNVDTIKGKSTEGSISIQGEGTKTTNLQQGLLKAFINFDGDTASATANLDGVNQSFNVTSLVDNTTGDYSINFTNNGK